MNNVKDICKHKIACIKIVDMINTASSRPKDIWTKKELVLLAQRMGDIAIESFEKEGAR